MGTIGVLYSCHTCGLRDVEVRCAVRKPEQDVVAWLETTMQRLCAAHFRRSPRCAAQTLDVKVPVPPGTKLIGGPVEH